MINHVLADGRRLSSIEGFQIPYNRETEFIYRTAISQVLRGGEQRDKSAERIPKKKTQAAAD